MVKLSDKRNLTKELESAYLSPRHYEIDEIPEHTCLIIDFMSFMRSEVINSSTYSTFGDLINYMVNKLLTIYPNKIVHTVFDSYINGSLKGAERDRRSSSVLELAKIDSKTKIPTQMEKFWASATNKVNFQQLFANAMLKMAKEYNVNVVISGTVLDGEPQPCKAFIDGFEFDDLESLKSKLEEADSRIIPHMNWSITKQNVKNFIILSNDTDVLVLVIHYFRHFKTFGAEKVWIRMGTRDTKLSNKHYIN